ncbi:MAG: NAD(P)/FAD-dependent oxidoreductase [Acidimicrobiales bacterium]
MNDLSADILIIGGGPGGAAAAIEAVGRGLDVIVVDKSSFPRDKCCGDGLTTGALRHLDELGLDPAAVPSWQIIEDVFVRTPSGRERAFPLPSPASDAQGSFAAVARRRELDAELLALAGKVGAEVYQRHELTGLQQTDEGVRATVTGPAAQLSITARYAIAADGMWSPTRKLLGIDTNGYRGDWHAFRQYFNNVTGRANKDLLVWFEPDLLPGYAWSFPVSHGSANVGFGVLRKPGQSVQAMKGLWADILARPHVVEALGPTATPEDSHRAWPIPARLGKLPFSNGRVLFVGDALAAADPMTGEGIGQALETGRAAAVSIAESGSGNSGSDDRSSDDSGSDDSGSDEFAQRVRSGYEDELRRGMMRDHRLAGALSSVLASKGGIEASVTIAGASNWTRSNFARWLFEDYPRAALVTPRRWRRGLFSSPGAFR